MSRHDLTRQLIISRNISCRRCQLSDLCGMCFVLFGGGLNGRRGLIWFASRALPDLASRLDISQRRQPTCRLKVNSSTSGTYRLLISREALQTHSCTNQPFYLEARERTGCESPPTNSWLDRYYRRLFAVITACFLR